MTDEDAVRGNFRRIDKRVPEEHADEDPLRLQGERQPGHIADTAAGGRCIDAVSVDEARLCLRAGFTPDRILYTGVMVSDNEMQQVVDLGIPINMDSISS